MTWTKSAKTPRPPTARELGLTCAEHCDPMLFVRHCEMAEEKPGRRSAEGWMRVWVLELSPRNCAVSLFAYDLLRM